MIELTLPTMTCAHCVRAVSQAVRQLDPQASVDVDLATKRVRIESQRPADDFRKALAEEGYDPA